MNHFTPFERISAAAVEAIYDDEEFFALPIDKSFQVELGNLDWEPSLKVASWSLEQTKVDAEAFALWLAQTYQNYEPVKLFDVTSTTPKAVLPISEEQLHLPIQSSFSPSEDLIDTWKENAAAFGQKQFLDQARRSDAAQQFVFMLGRLIGSFAQEKRAAGKRAIVVADGTGDFEIDLQLYIGERFMLAPQKSSRFFELLYRDLMAHESTTIFSGAWGFLAHDSGQLKLALAARQIVRREGFVKAREIR